MNAGRAALIAWLGRSHLQKQQLAGKLGISKAYMSQILHGDRRPGLDLLLLIADVTGVPVNSWAAKRDGDMATSRKTLSVKPVVSNKLTEHGES